MLWLYEIYQKRLGLKEYVTMHLNLKKEPFFLLNSLREAEEGQLRAGSSITYGPAPRPKGYPYKT
ncbi:MAG: hypothetical protein BGO43_07665 [Gammaproteobacteria bacterium 39-13]|nr:hypothetical protein [Gammaproteobacteria bacterium]OJV93045.1 MAG: hypothetical protein BGO43_07665 [Gammaproteobacteria bacterium 39-13]